jgi:hypothetical protein
MGEVKSSASSRLCQNVNEFRHALVLFIMFSFVRQQHLYHRLHHNIQVGASILPPLSALKSLALGKWTWQGQCYLCCSIQEVFNNSSEAAKSLLSPHSCKFHFSVALYSKVGKDHKLIVKNNNRNQSHSKWTEQNQLLRSCCSKQKFHLYFSKNKGF